MTFMTHLAHGAIRMGPQGRKILTDTTINLFTLTPGKYIIHGRFGDAANSVANAPIIQNAPVEMEGVYPAALGYTLIVDVDSVAMGSGLMGTAAMNTATGGSIRKMEVTLLLQAIATDSRYWGDSASAQRSMMSRQGVMKWEAYGQVLPQTTGAGDVVVAWTPWTGITPNVSRSSSITPRVVSGKYVVELSLSNNWVIDNYSPTIPISLFFNNSANSYPSKLSSYDGIVTITLNTVSASGTPTFASEDTNKLPTWIKDFIVTQGKKARLIIDYSGSLITAYGIDLSASTTVY